MNKEEHLLMILAEECAEVIKEVSKSNRFGLDDWNPMDENQVANRLNLENELADLIAVADMLKEEGYIGPFINQEKINKKKEKVRIFMEYSKKTGKLK